MNANEIVKHWLDSNTDETRYSKEVLNEIAVNCVSLSNTWFNKVNPKEKQSFEVQLYDKENLLVETLHGVDSNNLPHTLFNVLASNKGYYSKLSLSAFKIVDGNKVANVIGELDIC